jgi:hypothetical protein
MIYNPTPRLSPTTSIESTDSLVTPNYSDTSTFVDSVVSEDVPEGHFFLFKNSSEVWEEFEDAGYDPFETKVADAGIPISPSSSLVSGIDLLGDTSPPLPEPTRSESHQAAVPRHASLFDFPSPPILVPNPRMRIGELGPINGSSQMVSLVSHPNHGASHECLAQPIRHSRSSALHRWSTLPPAVDHPDKRRGSIELTTSKATGTFLTRAAKGAIICTDVPVRSLPFVAIPSLSPRPADYDVPSPVRRPRQEASDTFTSFIDMSANKSTLSASRVHKLFSKIAGGLKSRSKRH